MGLVVDLEVDLLTPIGNILVDGFPEPPLGGYASYCLVDYRSIIKVSAVAEMLGTSIISETVIITWCFVAVILATMMMILVIVVVLIRGV